MERNELFNLKKTLEKALHILEGELQNASPCDTECDSRGFVKPKKIYAGDRTVERVIFNNWDEIPEEFTVERVRAMIHEKFKTENTSRSGQVAWRRLWRRSHAAFSVVLARWVCDGYLKVTPDSGRYPHTYFKIHKNGATAT
jgi:hypothetical protein